MTPSSSSSPSSDAPAAACPSCGATLDAAADTAGGLCAPCLLRGAMDATGTGDASLTDRSAALPAPPPLEKVAAAFPHLEILSLLGQGGMSSVYLARQPKLDRLVALKILSDALTRDPAFAGRFAREGRLLARLSHPNIVTVHDFGESGGFHHLLMEHVDGVNLRQAMRAGRFTPAQALAIVPRICEALQYAHDEGVLHRDIKPENILLDARGRVKLADFGIAKLMAEAESADGADASADPSLTGVGSALGTPNYMAPEQRGAPATVDRRADIYSLGVVFYELLTGELPTAAFVPPSTRAEVDARVDAIVRQALERERTLRQGSAAEFRTQLETAALPASAAAGARPWRGGMEFEYRSPTVLFGLPLLHVVTGRDPVTGKPRVAHGIFAFGEIARGVFAFGGRARGFFAFGGLATGVIAFGGVALGIVTLGGLSLGVLGALGGFAAGLHAMGGVAIGWYACGGVALGWYAFGGTAFGEMAAGGMATSRRAIAGLQEFPPVMQAMAAGTRWTWLLFLAWVPATLAAVLIPRFAAARALENPTSRAPLDVCKGMRRLGTTCLALAAPLAAFGAWIAWQIAHDDSWNPSPAEAFTAFGTWIGAALLIAGGLFLRRAAHSGRPPEAPRASIRGLGRKVLMGLILAVIIRSTMLQAFTIPSNSGAPEIPRGAWILVWKLARDFRAGEFVTYRIDGQYFAGRVVAVDEWTVTVDRADGSSPEIPRSRIVGKVIAGTRPSPAPAPAP